MDLSDDADARVAAAILARGQAPRLHGANTAALVPNGARMINRQLAVRREVTESVFAVVAETSPAAELGLPVLPAIIPRAGALGGIYTATVGSPCERALVSASDARFVASPLMPDEAPIVFPQHLRGSEPRYASSWRPNIRRIEGANLRAAPRLAEAGPEALASYDPDDVLFVNVNTPHDYERDRGLIELGIKPMQDRITE